MEAPSDQLKKKQVMVRMNADWLGRLATDDVGTGYFLLPSHVFSFQLYMY